MNLSEWRGYRVARLPHGWQNQDGTAVLEYGPAVYYKLDVLLP